MNGLSGKRRSAALGAASLSGLVLAVPSAALSVPRDRVAPRRFAVGTTIADARRVGSGRAYHVRLQGRRADLWLDVNVPFGGHHFLEVTKPIASKGILGAAFVQAEIASGAPRCDVEATLEERVGGTRSSGPVLPLSRTVVPGVATRRGAYYLHLQGHGACQSDPITVEMRVERAGQYVVPTDAVHWVPGNHSAYDIPYTKPGIVATAALSAQQAKCRQYEDLRVENDIRYQRNPSVRHRLDASLTKMIDRLHCLGG